MKVNYISIAYQVWSKDQTLLSWNQLKNQKNLDMSFITFQPLFQSHCFLWIQKCMDMKNITNWKQKILKTETIKEKVFPNAGDLLQKKNWPWRFIFNNK